MKYLILMIVSVAVLTGCAVDMNKMQTQCNQADHLKPNHCTLNQPLPKRPDWQDPFYQFKRQHQINTEKAQ